MPKKILNGIGNPYIAKTSGRRYIRIYEKGECRDLPYARFLMEQKVGRRLLKDETVDHINRDKLDDRIENLRVISNSQHLKEDVKRARPAKCKCVWCGVDFERMVRDIRTSVKGNNSPAGPFCGKRCSGKYGLALRWGNKEKLQKQEIPNTLYYYLEKTVEQ